MHVSAGIAQSHLTVPKTELGNRDICHGILLLGDRRLHALLDVGRPFSSCLEYGLAIPNNAIEQSAAMPRKSKVISLSMPPEMAEQLRQAGHSGRSIKLDRTERPLHGAASLDSLMAKGAGTAPAYSDQCCRWRRTTAIEDKNRHLSKPGITVIMHTLARADGQPTGRVNCSRHKRRSRDEGVSTAHVQHSKECFG